MKLGILTSGGDCAGLNAVIRAIGLYVYDNIPGAEIVGIPDGYGGLIEGECFPMKRGDFGDSLLREGGTVLGTSRQPYKTIAAPDGNGSRLSRMCGITPEYFRRIFAGVYGISPKRYIENLKLTRAKELLQSGMYSVTEAATLSGYTDMSHFSRCFKKYTGVAPKNF